MKFEATDCITIVGTRGCGKTTLSKLIQKPWPKQIILDPVNEYSDGEIFWDFKKFGERLQELHRENTPKFRVIFRFHPDLDDPVVVFDAILRAAYNFRNVQVVVEEVQLFSDPHNIPKYLKNCLMTGRHQGLSLVFITQRPGQLNKNILSQCRHIFAGQLHDRNDISYLSNFLGDSAERLPNLPKGKFIYFSPGKPISLVTNQA